jgi:transcriptional regulator with XRE-family HTH domain
MKSATNSIDSYVGAKVRMRRMFLRMTQNALAEALGVSFQQIQKYEKGINTIGASRLHHISCALNVFPSFFLDGLPVADGFEVPTIEPLEQASLNEMLSCEEELRLIRSFVLLADPEKRKKALAFIGSLIE